MWLVRHFSILLAVTLLGGCGNSSGPTKSGVLDLPIATGGTVSTITPPAIPDVPATPGVTGKCGQPMPATATVRIPNSGRKLTPLGRMTAVGNFPTGGKLSPDGRFYWSVAAGHGFDEVQIVELASGKVVQILPLPADYGQMVFSPDGSKAYVSGEPKNGVKSRGPTMGDGGDVVHVFAVNTETGQATEQTPISIPAVKGGSGQINQFPPSTTMLPDYPVGMAITPDGKTLVVALYNSDAAAIINLVTGAVTTTSVGKYPFAVGIESKGRYAYVSNAYDGTLSVIDLTTAGSTTAMATTISGLGGPAGDQNSQPQFVLPDPRRAQLYVAVTNHDGVAVVSTMTNTVTQFINLKRPEGYGTQPVALALAPDGETLFVANAGENSVTAVALAPRDDGSADAYEVIGKIPTADYATDVQVTPDGCTLVWQAGRGVGAGPNPLYTSTHGYPAVNNDPSASPYPSYVPDMLIGRVGVLPLPSDADFRKGSALVEAAMPPENAQPSPANTPVHGAALASGGFAASGQIKYVFYVVKENRTYDQVFGSDQRGNGDPGLQVLEDNCGDSNKAFQGSNRKFGGCGTTPNAHALSRMFVLLDNFYEDSEVSTDGHAITTGAYASNYSLKSMHQDYSRGGRPANEVGVFPVTFPPKKFLFDQAAAQGLSFRIYGELSGGASAGISDDGRSTYAQVIANTDQTDYPSQLFNGCLNSQNAPNSPLCAFDCGMGCNSVPLPTPTVSQSRIDSFRRQFTAQVASCTAATIGTVACRVPQLNYMIMMSDHTNGVGNGVRDPLAMVADNDLGVGQLVQILSASAIWPYTAIFVVEDDAQDGADHVDAHRSPALVMGPYVKHGGSVVHTHYDQDSVIRTIELILGLSPLSAFDANATPMYDVFTDTPDNTAYTAVQPEKDLLAVCPCAPSTQYVSATAGQQLAQANARLDRKSVV